MPLAWLRRRANRAAAGLGIRQDEALVVSFIDEGIMTKLHGQFLGHSTPTDVLTFRYPREAMVQGEILIAPTAARRYARRHRVSYRDELARYIVHGLLHWIGHDDRTPAQQRTMRDMEDRLLAVCQK